METNNSLIKLDQAAKMLAEVKNIDDASQLIDLAEAARVYAKQIGLGLEAQNHAAEIKIRAQRKAGEILEKMDKNKGAATPFQGERALPPTYEEMDISYKDAHVWQTISKMPVDEFEETISGLLENENELSTTKIYREARKSQWVEDVKNVQPPTGKYQVIYADPPWQYNQGADQHGAAIRHYNTMSIEQLCDLPVKDLADDNAVLFIWVTSPQLEVCFDVIRAWGFQYKTSFVWDKVKHVMGHYNSVRHELLLICIRGSYPKQSDTLIDSVVTIERSYEHSEKPERFREIINEMYPNSKKIELFARTSAEGWESWGNDV
jgi:N6-adenosine-specific RNA methylase IME4